MRAIYWAKEYVDISDMEIEIVLHSRKSYLFHQGCTWIKNKNGNNFDCPMGSYDSAEVSDLIGLYMLNKLSNHIDVRRSGGQYRDDGLLALSGSGPELERIKKLIVGIFKSEGLKIDDDMICSRTTDFLDITLDLPTGTYRPFNKPNKAIRYISKYSNHPPSILKNLPNMIETRISDLSSNRKIFNETKEPYEIALRASGFDKELKFNPSTGKGERERKRIRKRHVLWYTPPYSMNVKTRIGGSLFFILNKHFPKGSELHKLFNKNTIKISYSCLPNFDAILKGINTNKLNTAMTKTDKPTNMKNICNSDGVCNWGCIAKDKCEEKSVVYKATVHVNNGEIYKRTYVGMTEGKLKDRISKHYTDFKHKRYSNSTTLSSFIWKLQEDSSTFQIEWDVVESKKAYRKGQKHCSLCACEKKWIAKLDGPDSLNSNKEYVSKCPHKWKFRLARITDTEGVDLLKHTIQTNSDTTNIASVPHVIIPRRPRPENELPSIGMND